MVRVRDVDVGWMGVVGFICCEGSEGGDLGVVEGGGGIGGGGLLKDCWVGEGGCGWVGRGGEERMGWG